MFSFCSCKKFSKPLDSHKYKVDCNCGEDHEIFEWTWSDTNLSLSTVILDNKREVLFHRTYSNGTAAIRGTKPFVQNVHYYWEVKLLTLVYGTDVMIGVGNDEVDLNSYSYDFCSLLGLDENSWGYSYRGFVQHDGNQYAYGPRFDQGTIIGCHLDMCRGTLEYYHNRKPLGIAFTGLKEFSNRLYPMISSTEAQSSIRLTCSLSIKASLQLLCLKKLLKNAKTNRNIFNNTLLGLKKMLQYQFWWLMQPLSIIEKKPTSIMRTNSLSDTEI